MALRGDLDVTGAADVEAAIAALVAPGQSLIIDMSALDFMDCAALGALRKVQTLARRGGGDVVLAAPQPQVRRLLVLTGKDEVFCVQASVQAAVADTAGRRRGMVNLRLTDVARDFVTGGSADFPPVRREPDRR